MGALTFGISLRVFHSIAHEWAQRKRRIYQVIKLHYVIGYFFHDWFQVFILIYSPFICYIKNRRSFCLMINYKTMSGGCWCLSQKYFKTENIDCFELEVTAAKDVGRFKLLSKTENLKKTLLFFPVYILRPSFIRVLKVNTFPFLNFYEKRLIFRMMKNKNRIRQLTEKHSNKEVLLAGATASHQRGLFEYHSLVKNIIEFNSRETIENKLSQKWKNPSFSRFSGKKSNCFTKRDWPK